MSIFDHYCSPISDIDRQIIQHVPPGGNWRDLPYDFPSQRVAQIRNSAAAGGGSRSTYYGRLTWKQRAYTISTYFSRPGNGCFIHPSQPRLLSLREGARLQTFPDNYHFKGPARSRYKQIGNAVPPLLAYQLARSLEPGLLVDLFCGAGGLSTGFEWAGFECAVAVDNDPHAVHTFKHNTKSKSTLVLQTDLSSGDGIRLVEDGIRKRIGRERPRILVGGPPCQGFSTAGNWNEDDPRNQLVHSYLRVVRDMMPEMVLMENVPALLWRRHSPFYKRVILNLQELGYSTSAILAHAESYGVPQLRRRLFVLATRDPSWIRWPQPRFAIERPAYRKYQPLPEDSARFAPSVMDAIGDLPGEVVSELDSQIEYQVDALTTYQSWSRGQTSVDALVGSPSDVLEPFQLVLN